MGSQEPRAYPGTYPMILVQNLLKRLTCGGNSVAGNQARFNPIKERRGFRPLEMDSKLLPEPGLNRRRRTFQGVNKQCLQLLTRRRGPPKGSVLGYRGICNSKTSTVRPNRIQAGRAEEEDLVDGLATGFS
jgi:hypothetical protein